MIEQPLLVETLQPKLQLISMRRSAAFSENKEEQENNTHRQGELKSKSILNISLHTEIVVTIKATVKVTVWGKNIFFYLFDLSQKPLNQ